MKKHKNILVIGLGMMGASLCKSIKKHNITERISGYDTDPSTLKYAISKNIINDAVVDYSTMDHPDMIILCNPISTYIDTIKSLLLFINKKTLLTNIASSKGKTHSKLISMTKKTKINYISSHPMVGSEKSGIKSLKGDIFKDKIVFIIDKDKSSRANYINLREFWKSLGSATYHLDSKKHDRLMSQTSHIAHLMAYIFIQSLPPSVIDENLPLLMGGGIREHVRLSQSNPKMWTDIFINNKINILKSLNHIQENMGRFKTLLNTSEEKQIIAFLENILAKTQ